MRTRNDSVELWLHRQVLTHKGFSQQPDMIISVYVLQNWNRMVICYHSAGKHDRGSNIHFTIYPLYYLPPLLVYPLY